MRGRMKGKASRGVTIDAGEFGLQALEPAWVTARQIEAVRRVLVREMKRRGGRSARRNGSERAASSEAA
jgi:large subunit ribosomal protein L16